VCSLSLKTSDRGEVSEQYEFLKGASKMDVERQNRFSRNAKIRAKYNLEYSEVQKLFGEEKAYRLGRADTAYTDGDIERIEQFRKENPIPGFWG
jgi:hypothetical protein